MSNKIPVGLELYSVRRSLSADLEGTLEGVRGYGYTAVEFAQNPLQSDAKRIKAALQAAGLTVSSWHTPYDCLYGTEENFKKTAEFMCEVGCPAPVVPGFPGDWMDSDEAIARSAEKWNAVTEKLAAYGLRTGYHNHTAEFKKLASGRTAWTAIREATTPAFIMQIDTGNALCGDADVNAEILNAPGRCDIVHLKPFSKKLGYNTVIGDDSDDIDYKTILPFCKEKGNTKIYVIEYESTALYDTDMESVRWALYYLNQRFGDLL